VLGPATATTEAPLAELLAIGVGGQVRVLTAAAALLLTLGAMNAYFAGSAKLGAALARDGALPAWFARGSSAGEVPRRSLAVIATLSGASLVVAGAFGVSTRSIVLLTTGSFVLVYVLGTAAAVKLLPRRTWSRRAAVVALASSLALLVMAGPYLLWPSGWPRSRSPTAPVAPGGPAAPPHPLPCGAADPESAPIMSSRTERRSWGAGFGVSGPRGWGMPSWCTPISSEGRPMVKKWIFAAGAGIGYVLGTRAGRQQVRTDDGEGPRGARQARGPERPSGRSRPRRTASTVRAGSWCATRCATCRERSEDTNGRDLDSTPSLLRRPRDDHPAADPGLDGPRRCPGSDLR
jgi:amino acid transporter